MIDPMHIARVADAITAITGNDDYDDAADIAAGLLSRHPALAAEATEDPDSDMSLMVIACQAADAEENR